MSETYYRAEDVRRIMGDGFVCTKDGFAWISQLIDQIPAADVEPVRHVAPIDCGMDEYYGGWVRCPNCDFDLNTSVAKFCGGCGAKMDLTDKAPEG